MTQNGPTVIGGDSVAGKLRWDVMASTGCSATSAPSPQPDMSTASLYKEPNGSVTASWPYQVAGRPVILYANFVETASGAWGMCSWDTADV